MTRQVELEGPELTPIAAASLGECDSRFGTTAEPAVSEWDGYDAEQLTSVEFEDVWGAARRQIASRAG